jgi:hypothetical protein
MKRIGLVLPWLVACSSPAERPSTVPVATPAASTACYAGLTTGMGQTARTIARRTVDPVARQIVEDVSHDDAGAHGAKSFHVVMTVDGDHFTMTEAGGAFTGTGTLVGEPWQWASWTSTSQIPNTGITVESDDEITEAELKTTKQIKKDGKSLATTTESLKSFDCADWDKVKAALAVPALDAARCERACRNYATLKYWHTADADISALPLGQQAAARQQKETELTSKLASGIGTCATACLAAKNAVQTDCMANAKSFDELGACDAD